MTTKTIPPLPQKRTTGKRGITKDMVLNWQQHLGTIVCAFHDDEVPIELLETFDTTDCEKQLQAQQDAQTATLTGTPAQTVNAIGAEEAKAVFHKFKTEYEGSFAKRKKIGEFKDPLPDENNARAIFKYRYLRIGHLLTFISTTGTGKSVLWTQGPMVWACGKPFMGIVPAQRLSFAIFETEDDDDEIADFRNNFRKGFERDAWNAEQINEAEMGEYAPVYYPPDGRTGQGFIDYVDYCLANTTAPHNVILINPFYDFIDGDMSKAADVKKFLNGLTLLAARHGCALVIVHHTNKVPSSKQERDGWLCGSAASYAGAGSMVLPASSRAVMFMRPTDKLGRFELIAGKRGERLGWKDKDGKPTNSKMICHSDGIIYWREPTQEEIEDAESEPAATPKPSKMDRNIEAVVEICRAHGCPFESRNKLVKAIMDGTGKSDVTSDKWITKAIEAGKVCTHQSDGQSLYIGIPEQFETDESDEVYWQR